MKIARPFRKNSYRGIVTLHNILEEQVNLQESIEEFKEFTKLKILEKNERKTQTPNNANRLLRGRQKFLKGFKKKLFLMEKQAQWKGLKLLTPKQIHQILKLALAQVEAGNTSLNLLNKIHQIKFSLYQAKGILKKDITT